MIRPLSRMARLSSATIPANPAMPTGYPYAPVVPTIMHGVPGISPGISRNSRMHAGTSRLRSSVILGEHSSECYSLE